MRKQRIILKHGIQRATIRSKPGNVLAIDPHYPGLRRQEPGNQPQQRRLATAARLQQGDKLALLDFKRNVAQRLEISESLCDALQLKKTRHHSVT